MIAKDEGTIHFLVKTLFGDKLDFEKVSMAHLINFSKYTDLTMMGKLKMIELFFNMSWLTVISVMEVEGFSFSDKRVHKAISIISKQI